MANSFVLSEYFKVQKKFLTIISTFPLKLEFVPARFERAKRVINIVFKIFWQLIILHLSALQVKTLLLNLNKSLDELIDYIMVGAIYLYSYFFTWYFQLRWKRLLKLMDFVELNFRKRSAKGLNYISFEQAFKTSRKYCFVWVVVCTIGKFCSLFKIS